MQKRQEELKARLLELIEEKDGAFRIRADYNALYPLAAYPHVIDILDHTVATSDAEHRTFGEMSFTEITDTPALLREYIVVAFGILAGSFIIREKGDKTEFFGFDYQQEPSGELYLVLQPVSMEEIQKTLEAEG